MKIIKAVAAIASMFAAITATADYLVYWEVAGATNLYPADQSNADIAFNYATIKANTESEGTKLLNTYSTGGKTEYWKLYAKGNDSTSTGAAYSGSFGTDVTSFLVELWQDETTRLGWQTFSLSDVQSSIFSVDEFGGSSGTQKAFTATQFVPEPTSGLLVLLGVAALSLRRKVRAA